MLILTTLTTLTLVSAQVSVVYVDDDADSGWYDVTHFLTIQEGVTAVDSDGTVNVAGGTYVEGQIVISKALTIIGDPLDKPMINPVSNLDGKEDGDAWFLVEEGISFDLSNVVMDGGLLFVYQAIRSHGYTTIDNVDFIRIQGSTSGTPYWGIAIQSYGGIVPYGAGADSHSGGLAASHLIVTESTFAQIGRIGVVVKGTLSTAEIVGSTYTGKGTGDYLDYAFEAGAGGDITVEDSGITNCLGVALIDGSTSAGIYVTDYYGEGTSATITGNTISGTTRAIRVGYQPTTVDASDVEAHYNNLVGNEFGVTSTLPHVDATLNWWGTADPVQIEEKISGDVGYSPWLSGLYGIGSVPISMNPLDLSGDARYPTVSLGIGGGSTDFPDVITGMPTPIVPITIENVGEISVTVDALVFEDGFFYTNYLWMTESDLSGSDVNANGMAIDLLMGQGYEGIAGSGETSEWDLWLEVPLGHEIGTYTGTLFFIAEAVTQIPDRST